MFDDVLIESGKQPKNGRSWLTGVISVILHLVIVGGVIAAGYWVKENPEIIEKPIEAFMVAAAPPPPPPPPPPAASSSTPTTPKVEIPQTPTESFVQPTETPREVPQADIESATSAEGGVVGGVEGGVEGGVVGGVVGGVIGGQLGGVLGGQLGGTGDMPVRVGGNVRPPEIITRVDPIYTETARKARIQGIVILEAIIDRTGHVTDVRVLKPLPLGLDQSAMDAVRKWRFKPGTLAGRPVPVIFNLTVNFRLQ